MEVKVSKNILKDFNLSEDSLKEMFPDFGVQLRVSDEDSEFFHVFSNEDKKIMGIVGYKRINEEKIELTLIEIVKEFKGRGLSKSMLKRSFELIKSGTCVFVEYLSQSICKLRHLMEEISQEFDLYIFHRDVSCSDNWSSDYVLAKFSKVLKRQEPVVVTFLNGKQMTGLVEFSVIRYVVEIYLNKDYTKSIDFKKIKSIDSIN